MKTQHRFHYTHEAKQQTLDFSEFDLHVNVGDRVVFPGSDQAYEVIYKEFHLNGDGSVDYVDYQTG
ncbi:MULTISPECIES: hypothetical protein [unclassified Pseudomonas]|uniref:hypothetical protein n=1 Tax=Pseudomonas TaxID=286 RepID=UPI0005366F51|nr:MULTISPECIES: hypothetical protein [unclassified Pseudomonas]MBD0684906.1 hypothetical protein [Pseudomonas sp. PSB18]CDF94295.1 hypothetical protein BN844_3738 [Pseudomonas sp. SHC52]